MTLCTLFFFKQKTAYEMRISDWSSDVCSSDLQRKFRLRQRQSRASHAFAFDGVAALAQSRGIDQRHRQAAQIQILAQHVASGAGDIGDDRNLGARKIIE